MTKTPRPPRRHDPSTIGWREWLALPDLGVAAIKAKVDTGARSSALHVFDLERFETDGNALARFEIHPFQDIASGAISVEAEIVDERSIRSSSGQSEVRPVIVTTVALGGEAFPVELTLTRRDEMGFRMLLGRQAVRGRFTVDPGRSFIAGKRPRR